jgi:hypothetical protein
MMMYDFTIDITSTEKLPSGFYGTKGIAHHYASQQSCNFALKHLGETPTQDVMMNIRRECNIFFMQKFEQIAIAYPGWEQPKDKFDNWLIEQFRKG